MFSAMEIIEDLLLVQFTQLLICLAFIEHFLQTRIRALSNTAFWPSYRASLSWLKSHHWSPTSKNIKDLQWVAPSLDKFEKATQEVLVSSKGSSRPVSKNYSPKPKEQRLHVRTWFQRNFWKGCFAQQAFLWAYIFLSSFTDLHRKQKSCFSQSSGLAPFARQRVVQKEVYQCNKH